MHLESPDSCDDDDCWRFESCHPALDVKELFSSKISSETCFSNEIISTLESKSGSLHWVTAVSNIRKRSSVNEGRVILQSLSKIWLDCVLQQRCHSSCCVNIIYSNRLVIVGVSKNHSAKTCFQVHQVRSKTEYRHNFRCYGDVKTWFPWDSVSSSAETYNDIS